MLLVAIAQPAWGAPGLRGRNLYTHEIVGAIDFWFLRAAREVPPCVHFSGAAVSLYWASFNRAAESGQRARRRPGVIRSKAAA